MMCTIILFVLCSLFTLMLQVDRSEQVSPIPIVDSKTGKELSISTQTYYAIQNQKTLMFLIWFGKNGTVNSDPEETQGQYWHIFEKMKGGWYKMSHHFGSHTVKIARSHQEGYYHIYNKDCFNGEHPNGDADDRGTIKCFVVEKGNMLEFNWRFLKKPELNECHSKKNLVLLKYTIVISVSLLIGAALIAVIRNILKSFGKSNIPTQVIYSQDNDGFTDTPIFPSQRFEKV